MTPMRWMWLSLVVALSALAISWQLMPSGRIAVHFGAGGVADDWGTRNELCGVLAVIILVLWGAMAWMTTHADRLHWSMVNIPRKDHWSLPENEPVARARLAEDTALTGVWSMLLITALLPSMTLAVREGEMSGALEVVTLAVIVLLTVALMVGIWRRQKFYRDVSEA